MGSRGPSPPPGRDEHPPATYTDSTHAPERGQQHRQRQTGDLPVPEPPSTQVPEPPYWSSAAPPRHSRSTSYNSLNQSRPPAILLQDNTDDHHDHTQSCWAQSVSVDEYVIVSGPTGIGAYVVWHCTVSTLKGGDLCLRKRYSEFDRLRENLVDAFPHAEVMIPALPRKSHISRFRPWFLEQRKTGLEHFLNCVLLNPEFASSPVLKDFIFY